MHQLDPAGRFLPSSLDISRAAARRHERVAALVEADRPTRRWRTHRGLGMPVALAGRRLGENTPQPG